MDYKTKSIITVAIFVISMVAIGILVNNVDDTITGATTAVCKCSTNTDCNDNDHCTEDVCLYPEECRASLCIHKNIEDCK